MHDRPCLKKNLSYLLAFLLLLSAGGLAAMDRSDFGRGFTSYYQGNYDETVLSNGTTRNCEHYLPGGSVMVERVLLSVPYSVTQKSRFYLYDVISSRPFLP